jgi:hypothetical protein
MFRNNTLYAMSHGLPGVLPACRVVVWAIAKTKRAAEARRQQGKLAADLR